MNRLIFHTLIAISFLFLPWYVTTALILGFVTKTGFFVEAFVWVFAIDIIYGSTVSLWGIPYLFSLVALVVFPCIVLIRRHLSW